MKHLSTLVRYIPKRTAIAAGLFVAAMVPVNIFAWGPERTLFTWNKPADYVTFNSMTDNPKYGDERNFVRVKEAGAANSTYADSVTLQPGKEYEVMIFFHNNANDNLNASGKGVAKGAYMRAELPAVVNGTAVSNGIVGATNAAPKEVFDEITLKSSGAVALRYVPNSAKITSNGAVNGKTLPDTLVTTGATLGFDALNGNLPGCEKYSGYVVYKFKADQPNFTVNKKVRLGGTKEWSESVTAKPGDTVDFNIEYKNTGTTWQENVIVKDKLPAGLTYVAGSTMYANANNPKGTKATDGITTEGINIGNYNKNSNAFVKFSAKVVDNSKLPTCGKNTLTNVARVETDNGNKEDSAVVVVTKQCAEAQKPKECKPGVPEGDARCKEQPAAPVTTETPKTPEAPAEAPAEETPAELPKTGPVAIISGLFGTSALGLGTHYWLNSRRALRDALKN